MRADLAQVTDVADMISSAVLLDVFVFHLLARHGSGAVKCFEDRNAVRTAPAAVIGLAAPRILGKSVNEPDQIQLVNSVAHLFALLTKHAIPLTLDVAFDKVAEEPMQLDAAMIRPGQATSPQAAGFHPKVATVFLDHDIGRHFRGAENTVLGLVNGEIFGDAIIKPRIFVVPTRILLEQRD